MFLFFADFLFYWGTPFKLPVPLTPDNSELQGKLKKVWVIRSSENKWLEKKGKKTVFSVLQFMQLVHFNEI